VTKKWYALHWILLCTSETRSETLKTHGAKILTYNKARRFRIPNSSYAELHFLQPIDAILQLFLKNFSFRCCYLTFNSKLNVFISVLTNLILYLQYQHQYHKCKSVTFYHIASTCVNLLSLLSFNIQVQTRLHSFMCIKAVFLNHFKLWTCEIYSVAVFLIITCILSVTTHVCSKPSTYTQFEHL